MVSHNTAPSGPSTDASDQKVSWALVQPGNSSPVKAAKLPDADETDRWDRSGKSTSTYPWSTLWVYAYLCLYIQDAECWWDDAAWNQLKKVNYKQKRNQQVSMTGLTDYF